MRAIAFSLICLGSPAFGFGLAPNTEDLLREADAIALVSISDPTDIVPGEFTIGGQTYPGQAIEASAEVTEIVKGRLPRFVTITQQPHDACLHTIFPGQWLLFLKRGKAGWTVFRDPLPITDGTLSWYTTNWRWPTADEMRAIWDKNPEARIAPEFADQPVAKVTKHIGDILNHLKHKARR